MMIWLSLHEMENFRYFLHLAYNGTSFHGWQLQPNAITVQEVIEKDLSKLLGGNVLITGAGRTDTGVHARNYFAHFDLPKLLNAQELQQLVYKLNRMLPPDISVYEAFRVKDDVHARFSALSRTYHYYISRTKNPFIYNFAWNYVGNLDVPAMEAAAEIIKMYSDFTAFAKTGSETGNNLCTIFESHFIQDDNLLIYRVSANRFLRNMVRAIMGTLLEVGKGRINISHLHELIKEGTRSDAGESVPARGLFLENISYPTDIRF